MQGGRSASEGLQGLGRREVAFGAAFALLIHVLLGLMLATAGGDSGEELSERMLQKSLCDGVRCALHAVRSDRRGPDSPQGEDLGIIEASVIPQLGLAEDQKGLPKLTKYEQAERIEEAVNLTREPIQPKDTPKMDVKKKDAERDKRKPGSLAAILGAPEDDDPRKRATALDKIVGSAQGSVWGSGTAQTGNLYGGKVALAIREQFTIPPFLSEDALMRLRVRVKVTKMSAAGQILAFEIVESATDARFTTAAIAAIKRFAPADGGMVYLPAPDSQTLDYINSRGMVIDLDGALFKR